MMASVVASHLKYDRLGRLKLIYRRNRTTIKTNSIHRIMSQISSRQETENERRRRFE